MKVFYVDPQSYLNLALYDKNLIENLDPDIDLRFYGNILYEFDEPVVKKIYRYSRKGMLGKAFSYVRSQRMLKKEILQEQPDAVHFQWFKAPAFDYRFLLALKRISPATKIVYTLHDAFGHDKDEKDKAILVRILSLVDKVIVHTDATKEELLSKGAIPAEKIEVASHGVLDLANLLPPRAQADVRLEAPSQSSKKFIFAMLGAMDYYKGTDMVIDAWESSRKLSEDPRLQLLVAGRNPGKPYSVKSGNVLLIQRLLDDSEFYSFMESCQVVLLPYRKISQSGLLLSAVKMRKRLLVTDVGELTAPFRFGQVGWILRDITPEALRSLMEDIVEQYNATGGFDPIPDSVWEDIERYYSWEEAGASTSQVYRSLKKEGDGTCI